jgi:transcriptional regulator with XRE-family HTH domain
MMAKLDLKKSLGTAIKRQLECFRHFTGRAGPPGRFTSTYISDLERAARDPSIGRIEKLAGALQVSGSKLFEQSKNTAMMSAGNPRRFASVFLPPKK